jgi:hypothetical protein
MNFGTLGRKLDVIKSHEHKKSTVYIANATGIPESTLRNIEQANTFKESCKTEKKTTSTRTTQIRAPIIEVENDFGSMAGA